MSVAATLLCYFTMLVVPIAGILAGIFTPFSSMLFYFRRGRPKGYWVPVAAAAVGCVLLLVLDMAQSIPYFLAMLLLGFVLGFGMRSRWSLEKTVAGASILVFVACSVFFVLSHLQAGLNPLQVLEEDLRRSFLAAIEQAGALSPEARLLEEALQRIVPLMAQLAPGGVLSSLLVVSWLNLLILKRYCRLHNCADSQWNAWSLWKAPEPLVWGVIACGFILLLPSPPLLKTFGLNSLIVLGTVYLFQGMAVLGFYFERWRIPRFLRAVLYGFVLLQQIATLAAIFMGLFDMWFDFRRLSQKPNSNA